MLKTVSIDLFITIWLSAIFNERVLLISSSGLMLSQLFATLEQLLWPFSFEHAVICIPVVCNDVIERVVNSYVPTIAGVLRKTHNATLNDYEYDNFNLKIDLDAKVQVYIQILR